MAKQISPAGIALTESCEGFSPTPYIDNGQTDIGYGSRIKWASEYPNGITPQQAGALLEEFAPPILAVIEELFPASNQNQTDALWDFGYNLGPENLRTMMGHGIAEIPHQMVRWDYDQGKPNHGLLARRVKEVALYLTPESE